MRIQNRATSWLESDVSTALIDDPQIDEGKLDTQLLLRALFFLFHVLQSTLPEDFLSFVYELVISFIFSDPQRIFLKSL